MPTETVYRLLEANTVPDVAMVANWLQANAHTKPVAVAYHPKRRKGAVAFATSEEVLVLALDSEPADAFLGVLRSVLVDQPQIELVCRDMFQDICDLTRLFAKTFKLSLRDVYTNLAPACVGDLVQAANVAGFSAAPKSQFKTAADDAYDVSMFLPQYELSAPAYYSRGALPFARLQAEGALLASGKDWIVSYADLWLRSFASFSGDPTLAWVFNEQRDVIQAVATTLKVTATQAQALLLWQAHGRDISALAARFVNVVDELPADLPAWSIEMDRHYPVLCASTLQMGQAYLTSGVATTLYGRRLRRGRSPGEAAAFRIFGSVEDLIVNAAVSFWQNRISSEIMLSSIEGGPNSNLVRLIGVGPSAGKDMWRASLAGLSPLGNPLSIGLAPVVTIV